jgi:FkbM family methyltransferase
MSVAMNAVSYVLETLDRTRRIRESAPGPARRELQRTYLKLRGKYKLRRVLPASALRSESICGFHLECLDYGTLVFLFEEIFLRRDYEFTATTERPLIFDCGSNIGMALVFFKRLYPGARVVAFEPSKESFDLLARNVEANRLREVELHNIALSRTEGPVEFFVSEAHPASLTNCTSAGQVSGTPRTVSGALLSKFVTEPVDFLKMDIEGAEASVLEELADSGGLPLVREMVVEYHHHIEPREDSLSRTLRLLEDNGFGYQIRSLPWQAFTRETFQDLLIHAYRK